MKILAIDTSSTACSVAFLNDDHLSLKHELQPLQHANCLLRFIEELLGSEIQHLDALAWGRGPGSFTGLRIGASVIQALGFARDLPVISISSMAALAQSAYQRHGWKKMMVAVDARMQEIYWGVYHINSAGYAELVNQELLLAPQQIPTYPLFQAEGGGDFFQPESYAAVGQGWAAYETELKTGLPFWPKDIDDEILPNAAAIAELAKPKFEKGEWIEAIHALPMYLRENICRIS